MVDPKILNLVVNFDDYSIKHIDIMRGDSVKFVCTFPDYDTSTATKLRIFAYMTQTRKLAFSDEFEKQGDAWIGTFASTKTGLYAGGAVLTVQLATSNDDVINSQMFGLVIHESYYSGIVEPSENIRDKVLDAVADAELARDESQQARDDSQAQASAAYSSEQAALAYSQSANASAQASAQSASLANEAKDDSITAQNNAQTFATSAQQSADASQESAERAEEIVEQAEQTFDVASFVRRGELWFNNGGLSVGQKWTNGVFSFLFTFNMSQADYDNHAGYYQWIWTSTYNTSQRGFHLSLRPSGEDKRLLIFYRWTNSLTGENAENFFYISNFRNLYCDSKPHTFALVFDGANLRKYMDGIQLGGALSITNFTETENTLPLSVSRGYGKLSRIKYFNFDITSQDSPYTLQDYISGKDEPPSLHSAYNVVLTDSLNWFRTAGLLPRFSSVGMELSIMSENTLEEGTSGNRFGIRVNIPIGSKIKVQSAVNTMPSGNLNFYIRNDELTISSGALYSTGIANGESLDLEYVATDNVKTFCFIWGTSSDASQVQIGDTVVLRNFQISIDGALLSLSNYTVQDGASRKIFDNSGQGNHATITGDVKGTHDNAIANLINFITQQV